MAELKSIPVNDWLRSVGEVEAETDITIGTRANRVLNTRMGRDGSLGVIALGKLIELKRRESNLTVDALAESANVEAGEIVKLEHGVGEGVSSAVVLAIANALQLPPAKLVSMLGTTEPNARPIRDAAVRFTARTSGTDELRPTERAALSEFVGVLVGK